MYMVTLIYVHVCNYFQESESCLPSIPSRREGTASNCKYNAIAVTSTHNAIYSTQKCMKIYKFCANKTHKLALVKTEYEA